MGKLAALVLAVALAWASNVHAQSDAAQRKPQLPQSSDKRIADLEKEVAGLQREMSFFRIPAVPESIVLCNRPIPLTGDDNRERFEREFFQMLENRGLLTILVKRYAKFAPTISEEINKTGLPLDLIYLALTESYLNPRVVSKANASGMWQFMKETGKREGLNVNDIIDERYSVVRSTRAALSYLKKLYDEFGDWLLAMAAYNCGEGRIREVIANQNTRDFFEMHLPEETDRYIYRIAATKEIIANPKKYGLAVEPKDAYKSFTVTEFTLDVKRDVHTGVLAQAMDVSYRAFRELNLHLRKYTLPKGLYYLNVPADKTNIFLRRIKENPNVAVQLRDKS